MMNFKTCTRLFITGICDRNICRTVQIRPGQFAHIFGLITFFEFLNFYRTTDFTMQNVVCRIISITRNITGQGFYLVWSKVNGLRSKWAIWRVQSEWSGAQIAWLWSYRPISSVRTVHFDRRRAANPCAILKTTLRPICVGCRKYPNYDQKWPTIFLICLSKWPDKSRRRREKLKLSSQKFFYKNFYKNFIKNGEK